MYLIEILRLKIHRPIWGGALIFVPIVTKIRKGWTHILFPATFTRSELMRADLVSNSRKPLIRRQIGADYLLG